MHALKSDQVYELILEKINNKEVLRYTIEAFENSNVDEIIICANKSIIPDYEKANNMEMDYGVLFAVSDSVSPLTQNGTVADGINGQAKSLKNTSESLRCNIEKTFCCCKKTKRKTSSNPSAPGISQTEHQKHLAVQNAKRHTKKRTRPFGSFSNGVSFFIRF